MSYRYSRLANTTPNRTSTTTNVLYRTLNNLQLTMEDFKFSGEYSILIFDFLSRLVEKAVILDVNQWQLNVFLLHMFTKTAALNHTINV